MDIHKTWSTPAALEVAAAGEWYDYCAGTWYQRSPLDTAPCTGTVMGAAPSPFVGTSFEGLDGPSTVTGVYFFPGDVDIDVKRPNGSITIITGGDLILGPSANAPTLDGRLPGIFMMANGDVTLQANFSGAELENPAVIYTNKSLNFIGNPDTENIAFIARDELNTGTTYAGTGTVSYNGGALPDFGGGGYPLVVQWDEVR